MTKEELANRIKDRRAYLVERDDRYTQQYVADKLQMSREAYAKYEQGRNSPRALDIINLAKILQTTPSYFYEDDVAEAIDDAEVLMYYRGTAAPMKPAAKAALKAMYDLQDREDAVTTVGKKAE